MIPDQNGFDPGPPLVCPRCGWWTCAPVCPNYRKPEPPPAPKEVSIDDIMG